MNQHLIDMLMKSAEADKAKALLSLNLLGNSAVGIGDHSTGDYYKNAEEVNITVVYNDYVTLLTDYDVNDLGYDNSVIRM